MAAIVLFVLSVIAFSAGLSSTHNGDRTGAMFFYLVSTILFSSAAIVGTIQRVADELVKRFPRTGVERMVAAYERHEENERASKK